MGQIEEQGPQPKGQRVGTVASTIAILRLLAGERQPMGVNAIARRLQLTPSSCFNILKTLCAENVLEFDAQNKNYQIGSSMIGIARHALDPNRTFDLVRAHTEALAEKWSLTVGLWRVLGNHRIMLVGYAVGAVTMRIHLTVGQRLPLLAGATGRCIAATSELSRGEIVRGLEGLEWQRPMTVEAFLEDVEETRNRGWALDDGRLIRGATTLGVPVLNAAGQIAYCLTATMFTAQHPRETLPKLGAEMIRIAQWATMNISHKQNK